MKRDKILQEAEDYQIFLREWKFNHPQQKQPSISDWKKWFRVKYNYQDKVISKEIIKNLQYDIEKKKVAFGKTEKATQHRKK